MSLNSSKNVPESISVVKTFPNLARRYGDDAKVDEITFAEVDRFVSSELSIAGIERHGIFEIHTSNGEVPTKYFGSLCRWSFRRAWYYWIAEGPGIPPDIAEVFNQTWGQQCRVDGHCGCPSPREWFHGFSVGRYHIDTQRGLNAFADLLRSIYVD